MLAPATPFLTRPPAVRIGGTLRDAPQCGTIKSQADAAKISNVHFTCALHGLGQVVGVNGAQICQWIYALHYPITPTG